jgi:hypothetical protein
MRRTLRRWFLVGYVIFAMSLAALRHLRRSRHRHRLLRHVDMWPW